MNADSREFEVELGDSEVACRLPVLPRRDQVLIAYNEVWPRVEAQRQRDADAMDGASWEVGLVWAAALGVCWAGEPLDCPSIAEAGYRVTEYGEGVMVALLRRAHAPAQIASAGRACLYRLSDSMPSPEAIEEAGDPTGAQAESGTAST